MGAALVREPGPLQNAPASADKAGAAGSNLALWAQPLDRRRTEERMRRMRLHAVDHAEILQPLFDDPALGALLGDIRVVFGPCPGALGLSVTEPRVLRLSPTLLERPGARVLSRFGLELAWLRFLPGLPAPAALLLAAAAAARFLEVLPAAEREAARCDPLVAALCTGASDLTAARRIAALLGETIDATAPDAIAAVARLARCAQPLEALLLDGGDERLELDPVTGQNRYLCAPYPQPSVVSFSSCTASSIHPAAFTAAERARQALVAAALEFGTGPALRAASRRVTDALLAHFGIADLAEAVLAASGTDATLLLTGLLAAEDADRPITTILMSPAETGSGVPDAVRGRHFARCTASGTLVTKGHAVEGFPPELNLRSIALRTMDGHPRDPAIIAAEAEAAVAQIAAAGGRAVLHAIDGSKTGLVAPDRATCERLAAQFAGHLDVVVDACQARLEPSIVRRYLELGCPVLITGSKFFAAPGFCGAILFPRARLARIAAGGCLPDGLGDYADLTEEGVSRRCPGLLMRWEAALHDMRRFASFPAEQLRAAIDRASVQTRTILMREPWLRLIQAPRPPGPVWSGRRSVFTFAVRGPNGWMSADALRPIYVALSAQGCLLGQPVQLGGGRLGGLRVAFSAAQLARGGDCRGELAVVFEKLRALL